MLRDEGCPPARPKEAWAGSGVTRGCGGVGAVAMVVGMVIKIKVVMKIKK